MNPVSSSPLRKPTADEMDEQRIREAYNEWLAHSRERPGLWAKLVDLINQRSPAQVERMERERGL